MKSQVKPISTKSYPKLVVNSSGTVVLAQRHSGGVSFEGIVVNSGESKSLSLGQTNTFSENDFRNFEGEVVLSNY